MHAIHPHVPKLFVIAFAAMLLTIVVALAAASRVADITAGSSAATAAPAPSPPAHAVLARPSWFTNPMAPPPFKVVTPWHVTPWH